MDDNKLQNEKDKIADTPALNQTLEAKKVLLRNINNRPESPDYVLLQIGYINTKTVRLINFIILVISLTIIALTTISAIWNFISLEFAFKILGTIVVIILIVTFFDIINRHFGPEKWVDKSEYPG